MSVRGLQHVTLEGTTAGGHPLPDGRCAATSEVLELSHIEAAFLTRWQQLAPAALPSPVQEYQFHERRRWRFDFAWPDYQVAVECDGGQWKPRGGRHGGDKDREKLNAAAVAGWLVLRFSGAMLDNDPSHCLDQVVCVLEHRGAGSVLDIISGHKGETYAHAAEY